MGGKSKSASANDKALVLEGLVEQALRVAAKARKHKLSLGGSNFYANKLSTLHADAILAFQELSVQPAGDVTAMAEMIESVFSASTTNKTRNNHARELIFSLRTTWRNRPTTSTASAPIGVTEDPLIPVEILNKAKRGYIAVVGKQINKSYELQLFDACAVMMRRLLEIVIIEAFEKHGLKAKITDANGDYLHLSNLVSLAMSESAWNLSRNAKKYLPQVRDVGHMSAHGRYFTAQRSDIERLRQSFRIITEEFLHHAGLQ